MTTTRKATSKPPAEPPPLPDRTVTGLAVPYGATGRSVFGMVTFTRGSVRRSAHPVPVLVDHDRAQPVGVVLDWTDDEDALRLTMRIDSGERGNDVLARLASGSRTGLSVGIDMDPTVADTLARRPRSVVQASGIVREVSFTAVPAFDDARADAPGEAPPAPGQFTAPAVRPEPSPHHVTLVGGPVFMQPSPEYRLNCSSPAFVTMTAPPATEPPPAPEPVEPEPGRGATQSPAEPPKPEPAPPAAQLAGPALLTMTARNDYDRGQASLAADLFAAAAYGDHAARERLATLHAEAAELATFAVADTSGDGSNVIPPGYRGDLLVEAIDRGRPIISRLTNRAVLTNATPFTVPVEGEFTDGASGEGVADHTEGQAHAAEGTMTLSEITVTPSSTSGAWRGSRELFDATNPAIDGIVRRAMMRSYRRLTEAFAVARMAAATGAATDVTDTAGLIDALFTFYDARDEAPPVAFFGNGLFNELAQETLSNGEPRFPTVDANNREGTSAGLSGLNIRGVLGVKAFAVADRESFIVYPDDVMWGESAVRQFRYEEVEGPGIVKLAMWGYKASQVLRASGVERITIPATP